jgi:hypothetical protein
MTVELDGSLISTPSFVTYDPVTYALDFYTDSADDIGTYSVKITYSLVDYPSI